MIIVSNVLITFRITELIKMRNYEQVTEQRLVSCAAMEQCPSPKKQWVNWKLLYVHLLETAWCGMEAEMG